MPASTAELVLPPTVVVTDLEVMEGNSGSQIVEFTVELAGDHQHPASVEYAAIDGTATEADGDYLPTSGILNWAAGDNTSRTVQVTIPADTTFEPDEYFSLLLTNNVNCVIRVEQALGIVINDDSTVLVADPSPAAGSNATVLDRDPVEATLLENEVERFDGVFQAALTATMDGADNVDDAFTVDFEGDAFLADVISFHGGGGTGVDAASILGGSFSTVVHTWTNGTDGQTVLNGVASSDVDTTFNWSGLETSRIWADSIETLELMLPAGVTSLRSSTAIN